MYQLLAYLTCCCLLVSGITVPAEHTQSVEVDDVDSLTESSFEFPEHITLHELGEPTSEEDRLMAAHKVNWMPMTEVQHNEHDEHDEHNEEEEPVVETDHEQDIEDDLPCEDDPELEEQGKAAPEDTADEQELLVGELVPRDETACPTNANRGLTRLIINARPLLPVERLRNILAHAREDAEVKELLKLLRSRGFREWVARLRATREEGVLKDYVCQGLKLNSAYFLDYVNIFLNVQTTEMPTSPAINRRRGIRGLLQDLRDALPRAQLRDLYRRQLANDMELNTAVRRLGSSEFRRLLSNVRALPEYRVVRADLERVGVPLPQILNLVSNALGWGALDMGSETLIAG